MRVELESVVGNSVRVAHRSQDAEGRVREESVVEVLVVEGACRG